MSTEAPDVERYVEGVKLVEIRAKALRMCFKLLGARGWNTALRRRLTHQLERAVGEVGLRGVAADSLDACMRENAHLQDRVDSLTADTMELRAALNAERQRRVDAEARLRGFEGAIRDVLRVELQRNSDLRSRVADA